MRLGYIGVQLHNGREGYVRCVLSDFCTTSDELARSWNEGIVRYKYVLESDSISQIGELPWGTVRYEYHY